MEQKVTIHDISKELGIDSSTVSRALNNSPRVKQKTINLVLNKARELGYHKNSLASKLRTNKTYTIGVIVPRISRHFFSSVIAGIEEVAYEKGYDVMICQSLESLDREKKLMNTLSSNRVDGVLVSISMETKTLDHFKEYSDQGFPLFFFDRCCDLDGATNVIIDDEKASFEATEHLIKVGCKHIVHFSGPQSLEIYRLRLKGFEGALKKNGIHPGAAYIMESRLMKQDGIANAKKILKLPRVDGVVSANDTAAISAMQYLKTKGVNIPEDIAFIGFSDEPTAEVMVPSLSTVKQPDFEMGKEAARLLIERMSFKEQKNIPKTIRFATHLILRDSTKKLQK